MNLPNDIHRTIASSPRFERIPDPREQALGNVAAVISLAANLVSSLHQFRTTSDFRAASQIRTENRRELEKYGREISAAVARCEAAGEPLSSAALEQIKNHLLAAEVAWRAGDTQSQAPESFRKLTGRMPGYEERLAAAMRPVEAAHAQQQQAVNAQIATMHESTDARGVDALARRMGEDLRSRDDFFAQRGRENAAAYAAATRYLDVQQNESCRHQHEAFALRTPAANAAQHTLSRGRRSISRAR